MANLIIKSSADNLVLQGSDASPAITVGATGTTTFAEECTLANATITSGTFPAGHILQVVNHVSTTHATTTTASGVTAVSGAITLSNATNKIAMIASVTGAAHKTTANDQYMGLSVECTSATTIIYGPQDSTGYYGIRLNGAGVAGAVNFGGVFTLNELLEPDQSGAITVTIKAHGYPSTNTTVHVNPQDGVADARSTLTLMEVVAT
jgi:hypothetical protein